MHLSNAVSWNGNTSVTSLSESCWKGSWPGPRDRTKGIRSWFIRNGRFTGKWSFTTTSKNKWSLRLPGIYIVYMWYMRVCFQNVQDDISGDVRSYFPLKWCAIAEVGLGCYLARCSRCSRWSCEVRLSEEKFVAPVFFFCGLIWPVYGHNKRHIESSSDRLL